ncbi:MAG: SDR family oxidoreductase [Planctomycetaceae bacterium]|nr:SDR family oxidoreductase [Planctomycetaceae bacterium]
MTPRFSGKVAIVTGVGERGIGAAIAERLAEEGAALMLLWKEHPGRVLTRLQRRKVPVIDAECDVTRQADVDAAIDKCMSNFGQIDILVNNAGVEGAAPLEDLDDATWDLALSVNLTGAMRMSRAVLPFLPEKDGVIVNIASALGIAGCGSFAAYSASKAGLVGFTQSLAMEQASQGIRAVCVAPALVHTPMLHRHMDHQTPEIVEQIDACHPLGIGAPQDVASAVAFLASSDARWISGVTLPLGWMPSFALPGEPFSRGKSAARPQTAVAKNGAAAEQKTTAVPRPGAVVAE